MSAENDNLDDLFRQQLGQHATPPGADLQRRLAELAEAERLDALFRTGLGSHASQPRRELWERLEDEHLHPQPQRRRRVIAWWQLSAAAVLLLTLLAGGLWRGGHLGLPNGPVATRRSASQPAATSAAAVATVPAHSQASGAAQAIQPTKEQAIASIESADIKKSQKNFMGQATASRPAPSSNPIAATTRPRRTATAPEAASSFHQPLRPLDAAAGKLASTGRRNSPASQPTTPTLATPAAGPAPSQHSPVVAVAMTSAPEIVEVEVRRGAAPASPAPVLAAAEAAPTRRPRLRLGGLLRQADHLVHGEPVSLAEATGEAESLTLQARLGGRLVSKTIRL